MYYLLALLVPLISYFFQIYPRFFNKFFGVDVWTRMIEANIIRKNHYKIPTQIIKNGFILEGYFNYPPVFPWLISLLPKNVLFKYQGFIAPVFDVLQNYILFLIVFNLTRNFSQAIVSQLIYASIPLIILENSYLTPRSFGYLNFTLTFFSLIYYSINGDIRYLLAALFFGTLLFFVHKFAAQSILFICIFFSLFERNPLYIIFFASIFLMAFLVSGGYYKRIFNGHINNILFWVKTYKFRFAHQVRGLQDKKKKRDLVGTIYYFLGVFTPVTIIGTNLWLIYTFIFITGFLFNNQFLDIHNILIFKLSMWILFFYCFSILVLSFNFLTPIGEGQRYLEMVGVPSAIVTSNVLFSLIHSNFRMVALLSACIIFVVNVALTIFIQCKGVIDDKNRSLTKGMDKIFKYINASKKPRIMCIPHHITTMVLFNTNANVLVEIEAGHLKRIPDIFPVLTKDIKTLAQKYHLNMLVIKKNYATLEELKLKQKDILVEAEDTILVKL